MPILPHQSCSYNGIGAILCAVPDAKWLWLQTCFPYCHYWGYCSGLITSLHCQPFQRELNHAPPPPHVYLTHFYPRFPPLSNSETLLTTLALKDLRKALKRLLVLKLKTRTLSLLSLVHYLIQIAICSYCQTLLAMRVNHLNCNNRE